MQQNEQHVFIQHEIYSTTTQKKCLISKAIRKVYNHETFTLMYHAIIPLSILFLIVGIIEFHVLISKYNQYKSSFYCEEHVILWLHVATFCDIIIPILSCCGLRSFDENECGGQISQIVHVIICVLSFLIYIQYSSCPNITNIWPFVIVHVIGFYLFVCSLILFIVCVLYCIAFD